MAWFRLCSFRLKGVYSMQSIIIVSMILMLGIGQASAESKPSLPPRPRLGINLAAPADWNTELPFVDVFRLSRHWISQKRGEGWGKGPKLALDEHGWVKRLSPDCYAEALMCWINGNHYPSGNYTVLYEGEGKLEPAYAATCISRQRGRLIIHVDASKGGFSLRITETNPYNPVRNIHVIMPGFEKSYNNNPFHPAFLKRWGGVACLRFMDWMKTNGSKISRWSERPQLADATFTTHGVPLEVMIDLCNRLKADAWFCMPHQANDNYVRNFARLVKAKLDHNLKVYIEYSNEVWNNMFAQCKYSLAQAEALHLGRGKRPWEKGGIYYAHRSMEIFKIWEEVFGSRKRLIRVLAWQSGSTWWLENIVLTYHDAYKHADALAIAPYISMNVPPMGKSLNARQVANWTVDKILTYLEQHSLPQTIKAIRASKKVAARFGLMLLAYEGGQHMVGIAGGENNKKMTELFHAANAHPRLRVIYQKYFNAWTQAGGDLFCYYSSVSRWSKWGSWGAMQYYDDNIGKCPKIKAILEWAKGLGQKVVLPPAQSR